MTRRKGDITSNIIHRIYATPTNMKSNKVKITAIVSFPLYILAAIACAGGLPDEPENWDRPVPEDALKADSWRKGSDNLYLHDFGDYNGDKILDYASIMISKDKRKEGLLVYLSHTETSGEWRVLDIYPRTFRADGDVFMAMETMPPGHYETVFCFNIDENEQCLAEIDIPNDSISYFRFASSDRLFWWNDKKNDFDIFWVSD